MKRNRRAPQNYVSSMFARLQRGLRPTHAKGSPRFDGSAWFYARKGDQDAVRRC